MKMSIPCKVCESEFKELVEKMILNGESNNAIANDLQSKGFAITHASINRHKARHMIEHKEKINELATPKNNSKYDRNNDENNIDAKSIFDDMKKDIQNIERYGDIVENYKMLNAMLFRIVNNQMAITIELQEKYMSGKCKYPYEQIKGLQIVQDMLQKLELFSKNMFKHKSVIMEHGDSKEYVLKKGEQDKLKMPKYIKGNIFKNYEKNGIASCIEAYKLKHIPVNPYPDDYYGQDFHNAYKKGIEKGTSYNEQNDLYIAQTIYNYEDENKFKPFIKKLLAMIKIPDYDYDEIEEFIEKSTYND